VILYKYFPPERIDVIRDGMVRFTQLAALNDPLDCIPRLLRLDELTSVPEAEGPCCVESYVQGLQESLLFGQRKNSGVLCLTERPDSLLMWAHYAQNHEGFVIGFNTDHTFFAKDSYTTGLCKVRYASKRPTLPRHLYEQTLGRQPRINSHGMINAFIVRGDDFSPDTPTEDYRFVKSQEWEYEREWRLLRALRPPYFAIKNASGHPVLLFPFPHAIVHSIIIGCRGFSVLYPTIKEFLDAEPSYRHVQIMSAAVANDEFRIEIEPFTGPKAIGSGDAQRSWENEFDDLRARGILISTDESIYRALEQHDDQVGDRRRLAERPAKDNTSTDPAGDKQKSTADEIIRSLVESVKEALEKNGLAPTCVEPGMNRRDPTQEADKSFARYMELLQLAEVSEAKSELMQAIEACSSKPEGYYLAGLLHKNVLNVPEVAKSFFCSAIEHDPTHIDANYSLGNLHSDLSEYWAAEAAYRTALRYSPKHAQARTNLGVVYLRQGCDAEAAAAFRRAVDDDARCWQAHFNLASFALDDRRDSEASSHLVRSLEYHPSRDPAFLIHASALVGKLYPDKERLSKFVQMFASAYGEATTLWLLSLILRTRGQYLEAIPILHEVSTRHPDDAQPLLALAHVYREIGQVQMAEEIERKARTLIKPADAVELAALALLADKADRAIQLLAGIADSNQSVQWANIDPIFSSIRLSDFHRMKSRAGPGLTRMHDILSKYLSATGVRGLARVHSREVI
jgi:tetratricopeptide (TPR) repeat protein